MDITKPVKDLPTNDSSSIDKLYDIVCKMTRYGIKRTDTGEVLQEPYIFNSMTAAESEIVYIMRLCVALGTICPDLEAIQLEENGGGQ